jgi:hypothetical protein
MSRNSKKPIFSNFNRYVLTSEEKFEELLKEKESFMEKYNLPDMEIPKNF